jgi:dTDP-4-dehydrorhamnose reductase
VGGSGLLGSNFALEARKRGPVAVTFFQHPVKFRGCMSFRTQVSDQEQVQETLNRVRPDWVLNATGCTDVDLCETNPDQAREMNADVPRRLALAAKAIGAGFVHISTDAVFDGRSGGYTEQDKPAPINEYGASKLLGEQMALDANPAALVIRTNFFGWSNGLKPSYSEWLYRRITDGQPFPVFADVWFNGLLANTLAVLIRESAERGARGLLHLGTSTPCSKLEFARALAEVFALDIDDRMRPVSVDDLGLKAARPHRINLNCSRAEQLLGRPMATLKNELKRLRELRDLGYVEELRSSVANSAASRG